jgi:hypothetical protein
MEKSVLLRLTDLTIPEIRNIESEGEFIQGLPKSGELEFGLTPLAGPEPVIPLELLKYDFASLERKLASAFRTLTVSFENARYSLAILVPVLRKRRKRLSKGWRRYVRRCKASGLPFPNRSQEVLTVSGRASNVRKEQ